MNPIGGEAVRANLWTRTRMWRTSLYLNSYFLMTANILTAGFGFLFWTAAARLYATETVGLAAAAISAIGLVAMLSTLGLDYALVRFLPHAVDPRRVVNSSLTIAGAAALLLSVVFLVGLSVWSPALLSLRTNPVSIITVICASLFTTVVALLSGVYMARKRADLVLAQASIFSIAKVLFVVALSTVSTGPGLIGAWMLGLALAGVYGVAVLLPRVEQRRFRFIVTFQREIVDKMTHFAFMNYVSALLWGGPGLILPLVIINLIGPTANAHFYVAWNIGALIAMVPTAVSWSLFAHASNELNQLEQQTLAAAKFVLLLLIPLVSVTMLIGGKILLLFGSSYSREGLQLLRILAITTIPMTVNFFFFSVRRVQQRMGGVIASASWILGATLALSIILAPRLGLFGVGVAWCAAQTVLALIVTVRYVLTRF